MSQPVEFGPASEIGEEITPSDLVPGGVYILKTAKYAGSFNYVGRITSRYDPFVLGPALVEHFYAPRVDHHLFLAWVPPSSELIDGTGTGIRIHRYLGADAPKFG